MYWSRYLDIPDGALPPESLHKCVVFEEALDQVADVCAANHDQAPQLCQHLAVEVAHLLAAALAVPGYNPPKFIMIGTPRMRLYTHLYFEWAVLPGNRVGVTLNYR